MICVYTHMRDYATEKIVRLARCLRLLAEPNRLKLVHCLGGGWCAVGELVRLTGLSQTNVSFHLRLLREAGVVERRRQGPFVLYRLANPDLLCLLNQLDRAMEPSSAVDR